MEKEIEKQTETRTRKNKFILIVVILILLIFMAATLIYFKFSRKPQNNEIVSNDNPIEENFTEDTDLPTISDIYREEPDTDDVEHNIVEDESENAIQEPNNATQPSGNTTPSMVPENNGNTNSNINTSPDTSSGSNSGNNSDTSSNENNNMPDVETPPTPVAPSIPEVEPYVVKTETSKELTKSETKYGVVINTYTTSTHDVYSDGSKKVISSYDSIEYDKINYNATTSELLPDARMARTQYSSMINQVLENVNIYRQDANNNLIDSISDRKNLTLNENLCVAACARAVEMAYSSKFSHTRPNGSSCFSILNEMNISYRTAGENIASGYSSADSVSDGWKNSQGHYQNMISSNFSQIGIGVFKLEGTYYWVQLFN